MELVLLLDCVLENRRLYILPGMPELAEDVSSDVIVRFTCSVVEPPEDWEPYSSLTVETDGCPLLLLVNLYSTHDAFDMSKGFGGVAWGVACAAG